MTYQEHQDWKIKRENERKEEKAKQFEESKNPLSSADLYIIKSAILNHSGLTDKEKEGLVMKVQNSNISYKALIKYCKDEE